ncbi:Ig-like domain-containing protein [Aquimarina sp. 2201CG14-23]|uniref:Ig-like domain-containing protein n=1 Tax=Aquimarina mycalae TaxID=3040073 RepID=UPI002477FDE2|nr:Ig-like domain-containing protein [Aquimarina sp. 2201CG14-23]MDH7445543.1 Ig-like domain-containing protein [Aquimarina sp. 2201CG14-23]
MKNLFTIIIVCLGLTPKVYPQNSKDITFDLNLVTIAKKLSTSNSVLVYKGQISEHQLSDATPILGKVVEKQEYIQFVPMVPFVLDQKYTLVYDNIIDYYTIPIPPNYLYPQIKEIYPSASTLPSNLLKWYVRFSKPISDIHVYDHIKFLNASGDTISRAALPLENALVSDDSTLLTIWIEPGRQKRGLKPNKKLGAVFVVGETYTLLVSKRIKDTKGVSMQENYSHSFLITSSDRLSPNVKDWKIKAPVMNSVVDLEIQCNEAMDYGSTIDRIKIFNSDHIEIQGIWACRDKETLLAFTPIDPWKKDHYQILFDPSIEDLAGNNLERLFDSNINNSLPKNISSDYILNFNIE